MNDYYSSVVSGHMTRLVTAVEGVRSEVGQAAELRQELTDIGNGLADIKTEVADLTAAVRELTQVIASAQDRPRRWFSRRAEAGR
ncbi:hypothetical protein ACFV0L_43570 [Streptosporangium canum]|uniref:hypothetical protein n=1 Tax=Streptosporangium canum TaxID=324952 RepID=UPI00368C2F2A